MSGHYASPSDGKGNTFSSNPQGFWGKNAIFALPGALFSTFIYMSIRQRALCGRCAGVVRAQRAHAPTRTGDNEMNYSLSIFPGEKCPFRYL